MHLRSHIVYFLLLWKILKKLADHQCSSITKGCIYYIKHMYIQNSRQHFSIEVDWPEIWCLMAVSTMFHICTYCVFTLWDRYVPGWQWNHNETQSLLMMNGIMWYNHIILILNFSLTNFFMNYIHSNLQYKAHLSSLYNALAS